MVKTETTVATGVVTEDTSGTHLVAPHSRRNLLFVDDEPAVLEGLQGVLRAQRREWNVTMALGGPAGLEEIRRTPFDVIVTDMRMPILDGAELLQQAKLLQPGAVRIVLSGQTDTETALKTVFTAHQFLAKPCEVETLRGTVQRACSLQGLLARDELRALAGDVATLPTPPSVYLALTDALADPSCDTKRLANIVERDPVLCAKILQVANSAFFGLPRAVSSIAQATTYLGTLTLRNLALAMGATTAAKQSLTHMSLRELVAFQANSLLVGLLCRSWYAESRRMADEAFVAGMLRDIGHLVLAAKGACSAVEPDQHAALSAYMLGLWGIPHGVLEPVAYHEQPESLDHDEVEVVDVVHLADRIAAEIAPSPFQTTVPALDVARLVKLGVSEQRIDELRNLAPALLAQSRNLVR